MSSSAPLPADAICRVCRGGAGSGDADDDEPLFYPCKCTGSIRYVHQQCLAEWLEHSSKDACELCGHTFRFTPLFAPDMPSTLPGSVVLRQAAIQTTALLVKAMRFVMVVMVWGLLIPLQVLWVTRILLWSSKMAAFKLSGDRHFSSGATKDMSGDIQAGNATIPGTGYGEDDGISDAESGSYYMLLPRLAEAMWSVAGSYAVLAKHTAEQTSLRLWRQIGSVFWPEDLPMVEETAGEVAKNSELTGVIRWYHENSDGIHAVAADAGRGLALVALGLATFLILLTLREWVVFNVHDDDEDEVNAQPVAGQPAAAAVAANDAAQADNQPEGPVTVAVLEEYAATIALQRRRATNPNYVETLDDPLVIEHNDRQASMLLTAIQRGVLAPDHPTFGLALDGPYPPGQPETEAAARTTITATAGEAGNADLPERAFWADVPDSDNDDDDSDDDDVIDTDDSDAIDNDDHDWETLEDDIDVDEPLVQDLPVPHIPANNDEPRIAAPPPQPPVIVRPPQQAPVQVPAPVPVPAVNDGLAMGGQLDDGFEDDAVMGIDGFDGIFEAMGFFGPMANIVQYGAVVFLVVILMMVTGLWIPYTFTLITLGSNFFGLIGNTALAIEAVSTVLSAYLLDQSSASIKVIDGVRNLALHPSLMATLDGFNSIARQALALLSVTASFINAYLGPYKLTIEVDQSLLSPAVLLQTVMDRIVSLRAYLIYSNGIANTALSAVVGSTLMAVILYYLVLDGPYTPPVLNSLLQVTFTINKVAIFFFIELALFPVLVGFSINFSSLLFFADATLSSRWEAFRSAPMTSVTMHWFIGTIFMLAFSKLVREIRKLLRTGVIWFIRDPEDTSTDPFKEIVMHSAISMLGRITRSFFMYLGVILSFLFGFAAISHVFSPGLLPIRLTSWPLFPQLPLDYLVEFAIIYTLQKQITQERVGLVLSHAMRYLAAQLRLSWYLYGEMKREEMGRVVKLNKDYKGPMAVSDDVLFEATHPNAYAYLRDPNGAREGTVYGGPDVGFIPNGGFVRCPRVNNVRLSPSYPQHIPVDADDVPLSDKHAPEVLEAKSREYVRRNIKYDQGLRFRAPKPEQYNAVYVPPLFWWRLIAFSVSVIVFMLFVALLLLGMPVLVGRKLFATVLGRPYVHDLFSLTLGAFVFSGSYLALSMERFKQIKQSFSSKQWSDLAALVGKAVLYLIMYQFLFALLGLLVLEASLIVHMYIVIPLHNSATIADTFSVTYAAQDVGLAYLIARALWRILRPLEQSPRVQAIKEALYDRYIVFDTQQRTAIWYIAQSAFTFALIAVLPSLVAISLVNSASAVEYISAKLPCIIPVVSADFAIPASNVVVTVLLPQWQFLQLVYPAR
ncbi:hypothetical protein GQ42DRAFT_1108 [Ramicandelaber brevisporus]|nr:hypothetical protein GQ42DRAFT_1108 [Ramicandelaber brevisporus]